MIEGGVKRGTNVLLMMMSLWKHFYLIDAGGGCFLEIIHAFQNMNFLQGLQFLKTDVWCFSQFFELNLVRFFGWFYNIMLTKYSGGVFFRSKSDVSSPIFMYCVRTVLQKQAAFPFFWGISYSNRNISNLAVLFVWKTSTKICHTCSKKWKLKL